MKKQNKLAISLLLFALAPMGIHAASSIVKKVLVSAAGFGSVGAAYYTYNFFNQDSMSTIPSIVLTGVAFGIKTGFSTAADIAGTTWSQFKVSSQSLPAAQPIPQQDPINTALLTSLIKQQSEGSILMAKTVANMPSNSFITPTTVGIGIIIAGGCYGAWHFRNTIKKLLGFAEKASVQLDYLITALNQTANDIVRGSIDRELAGDSSLSAIAQALKASVLKVEEINPETNVVKTKDLIMSVDIVRARYEERKAIKGLASMPYRPNNDTVYASEEAYKQSNSKK